MMGPPIGGWRGKTLAWASESGVSCRRGGDWAQAFAKTNRGAKITVAGPARPKTPELIHPGAFGSGIFREIRGFHEVKGVWEPRKRDRACNRKAALSLSRLKLGFLAGVRAQL